MSAIDEQVLLTTGYVNNTSRGANSYATWRGASSTLYTAGGRPQQRFPSHLA